MLATPVVFRDIENAERAQIADRRERIAQEKKKNPQEQDPELVPFLNDPPLRYPPRSMGPGPGHALPGETRGALHLARGALSDRNPRPKPLVLDPANVFSRRRRLRPSA